MINKELKKLSRRELVDVIYQLKKNEEEMQEKISVLEEALEEKRIRISSVGSIAEAAVGITNIFSEAQKTADIYLNEIARMKEDTEKECAKMIEDTKTKVEKLLFDSKNLYNELSVCYKNDYEKWLRLKEEVEALEEDETAD